MKSDTTNNALSNGFRRLWDRTKRGLAVIVSSSVAGALAGGFLFGFVPYLVADVPHWATPGFEVVIHAVFEHMVFWGIAGAICGALVLVLDDHHLLAALAVGLGSIGLAAILVGPIADGTPIGVLGLISVICAFTIIVGTLVYELVYDD
ncbi:hypothetical protein [Actinomadura luteofluorescens]|uniref:hypothetical protein n=1 Tax=Actinomadura luteofluorescens TaxID=46163 RepID=UPI003D940C70